MGETETLKERYERLSREYEKKFGEPFYNSIAMQSYTEGACDVIERCIKRGTPCDYWEDFGLKPEQRGQIVI